jgi:DNA-binding NarL/FixJ family response regulator
MGTRIVLADRQSLFRGAIRALIESAGAGYEVVAEAGDGPELWTRIEHHDPDVVLLDMALPLVARPEEVVRRSRKGGHRAAFVLLSSRGVRFDFEIALRAGATAVISKTDSATDLLAAIAAARDGRAFLSPSANEHIAEIALGHHDPTAEALMLKLSSREAEVLRMISDGLSSKQIGEALHISARTVDTHRTRLMNKLGIHHVVGLVRCAIRAGLIDP